MCDCWPVRGDWQRAGMSLVMHDMAELSFAVDVMERKRCTNEGKCCFSQRLLFQSLKGGEKVGQRQSGCVMFSTSVSLKLHDAIVWNFSAHNLLQLGV